MGRSAAIPKPSLKRPRCIMPIMPINFNEVPPYLYYQFDQFIKTLALKSYKHDNYKKKSYSGLKCSTDQCVSCHIPSFHCSNTLECTVCVSSTGQCEICSIIQSHIKNKTGSDPQSNYNSHCCVRRQLQFSHQLFFLFHELNRILNL